MMMRTCDGVYVCGRSVLRVCVMECVCVYVCVMECVCVLCLMIHKSEVLPVCDGV